MNTNTQVAEAFVNRKWAKKQNPRSNATTFESDAVILYSYETPIAYHQDGSVHISTQYHSPTTTRHHSALIMALSKAGYSGCVPWPKIVAERDEPTTRFGLRSGRSDPDSPAVVWQRVDVAEAAD